MTETTHLKVRLRAWYQTLVLFLVLTDIMSVCKVSKTNIDKLPQKNCFNKILKPLSSLVVIILNSCLETLKNVFHILIH